MHEHRGRVAVVMSKPLVAKDDGAWLKHVSQHPALGRLVSGRTWA